MRNKRILLSILILIASLFMSIGYATINAIPLEITGSASATAQTGIFITDVEYVSNVGADLTNSEINNYIGSILNSTIALSTTNNSSSITYRVTMYNNTNDTYAFKSTTYDTNFYDNANIKFELNGLSANDTIASKASKTFNITFSYVGNASNNNILNSYLNFSFGKNHTITYVSITGNYQTNIADGLTYNNTFSPAPNSITVSMGGNNLTSGTDFTYSNGTLIISNVTDDLIITGITSSGGNGGTWDDPVIDNLATVYDPDDVPEGATLYTNVPGEPKVEADSSGNITRFEFTDTGTNGMTSPTGGFDTGVLAFDGVDYDIILKGRFNYDTKSLNPIIVMSSRVNTTVEGIVLFNSKNKQKYTTLAGVQEKNTDIDRFRMIRYNGGTLADYLNLSVPGTTSTSNVVGNLGYSQTEAPVTVTLKVMSRSNKITAELYDSSNNLIGTLPNNFEYDFSSSNLGNITVELGHWENDAGTIYDYSFTILEFSVQKLP